MNAQLHKASITRAEVFCAEESHESNVAIEQKQKQSNSNVQSFMHNCTTLCHSVESVGWEAKDKSIHCPGSRMLYLIDGRHMCASLVGVMVFAKGAPVRA